MNAHDVRHLRVCAQCGQIGDKRHMLELPNADDDEGHWWHGRCFIAVRGIDALLMMPRDQLDGRQIPREPTEAMLNAAAPWPEHWDKNDPRLASAVKADQLTYRQKWIDMFDTAIREDAGSKI